MPILKNAFVEFSETFDGSRSITNCLYKKTLFLMEPSIC
ncbi:hypothetical protein LEP1GSC151_5378 [Leptospira interrogans serovar Grippotyphosa str. LT2186]|uniref:Uncharacterized protein n=6 Tax=Leptospira interrogans TaxID=173 RepID=A0A0E2DF32_LEPIR|nr:hypothetical protein LEP1GSC007_3423 [Leptospira interrogans serovar Bulgarica str. Mallika]EJP17250.1 hypothetical protein LEP1GSC080_3278 [Leptospira interrogans str. FPW2026]EKO26856.1 hypothetical protein LEP1GSC104_1260 [Leptospira interrogans str. UI 12621]EKO86151.1 hypothetical protein LEP1GSC009_3649 [Leptospira interrogans serovar Grippotyphosa str. Andaman]EKP84340.1 hypothetical protein LEP1GSC020_4702 [Leptospira interrogans serovar Grippotyphosa str. 2006006986]EKR43393.1 hypo